MKLFRQGIFHCAYVALLSASGACTGTIDNGGLPGVEATGEAHDLRASNEHKKKHKKKKHWDTCEPKSCENLALHVDSHKNPEATEELERSIRVQVPQKLPALYWGSEVEAELIFEQDDKTVVCTYVGKSRKLGRALELESCDNGAKAADPITFDSVTLKLGCASDTFAKVHVKLHELEPCGEEEPTCDPAEVDDGDPCTVDACDEDGGVTHTPAADGTACDDGNVCNGHECCQAGNCVGATSGPMQCGGTDGENTVVFSTNFDDTLPSEISPGTATITPVQGFAGRGTDPRKFGGSFLRSPTAERVTLQLSDLPAHDKLDLRFLFAAIDSLDGSGTPPAGENFVVRVDDVVIFMESFANAREYQIQSYVPPAGVQLARRIALGFRGGDEYRDSAYDLGKDPVFAGIVHSASTATISFEYVGDGAQNINDESWAIDNLEVSVNGAGPCEDCGTPPPDVDDNDPCTADSCDPVLGVRHELVAVGTSCGDAGNVCNGGPSCNAQGECVAGAPLNCDDGNRCNGNERCDEAAGCVAGTPLSCDDGNACNGSESCNQATGCVSGTAPSCDDGNACNGLESCDQATGCVSGTAPSCDDGDACNGTETCVDASGCRDGTPPSLEDTNPCTIGVCDPDTGVSQEPAPEGTDCTPEGGPESGCNAIGECVEFR
jgi:hypothetical protein